MNKFPENSIMIDGVITLLTTLNPTEAELFKGLSVIEDTELVHFLPAERFKQLLKSKQLHLNRVDGYKDDTGEGIYPEINLVKSSNMDTQIENGFFTRPNRRASSDVALVTRKMTYVHCWFQGEPSSEDMWRKYGADGEGICIQGSSNRIRENIFYDDSKFTAHVSKCVYCDPDEPIPTGVSLFPVIRKDKNRFQKEKEIRLLLRYHSNGFADESGFQGSPEFQKLPVNLNGLIGSIYFGPRMKDPQKEPMLKIIKDCGLTEKIKHLS